MNEQSTQLMGSTPGALMTRRGFVFGLAALAGRPSTRALAAQPSNRVVIRPTTVNHVALLAQDVQRTADWYQRVLGMPVQFRREASGETVAVLRVGPGPGFVALYPANGAKPGFRHLGFGVENFSRPTIEQALVSQSVKGVWSMRSATEGAVEELTVHDPDNLLLQIQDVRYSGGGGRLGDTWSRAWTMPSPGGRPAIGVRAINHVTFGSSSKEAAERFYRDLFGLPLLSWDYRPGEPSKILGVSAGAPRQFIAPGQGRTVGVSHFCFGVDGFDRERVARALTDHGITVPPAGQDRRGCCGSAIMYSATETVYARDPDGFSVQFTDTNFCAGIGPLGTTCIP